jgi:transglutaminase-like putative cysteine protease
MHIRPSRVATLLLAVASLLLLGAPPRSSRAAEGAATERWYEILREGQKYGHSRVVWAPSTWKGKPTVHDTTTEFHQSVRDMLGMKDEFVTTTTSDLERSEDGTLWWMRTVEQESTRTITTELTWTGDGYEWHQRLEKEDAKDETKDKTIRVALDAPVMTDVESYLGPHARANDLKPGQTFHPRYLDIEKQAAVTTDVTIVGPENVPDERGTSIATTKVEERDPRSGGRTLMWIDGDGAFVLLKAEGSVEYHRTTRAQAEKPPAQAAEQSITTPSNPPLERIFSADRVLIDLHLRGDPDRELPKFPDSPWSRVLKTSGDDEQGWVMQIELKRYDADAVRGTLPVDASKFEKELESTVMMPVKDERLVSKAREIVGGETDLRMAAYKIARWVFRTLEKHSPDVGQADALQILDECRGDCSEHALLYVALCRAAGIPARLCSGYVSVGSAWGAHSWAEIWTGQWIGADPTTGEVGTGARYLFFGYPDRADSYPGVVSSRAQGRMRFVATRIEEGSDAYDLTDEDSYRISDRKAGRFVHVLAGIELKGVPEDWDVDLLADAQVRVHGPGLQAEMQAFADQGATLEEIQQVGKRTTFAGAPAKVMRVGDIRTYLIHSRRRFLRVRVHTADDDVLAHLEKVLAPTFAPRPGGD